MGLIQAESNLLGIQHPETGRNVGSGGWSNVVEKLARAGAAMAELAAWKEIRDRLEAEGPFASRSADTVGEGREEYGVRALERRAAHKFLSP